MYWPQRDQLCPTEKKKWCPKRLETASVLKKIYKKSNTENLYFIANFILVSSFHNSSLILCSSDVFSYKLVRCSLSLLWSPIRITTWFGVIEDLKQMQIVFFYHEKIEAPMLTNEILVLLFILSEDCLLSHMFDRFKNISESQKFTLREQ